MCAVSMIMDHYYDRWDKNKVTPPLTPTQKEIEEFYVLLERAREYDKKHNQPNCEIEEKKEKLRELSKELGIEIKFN